MSELQPSRQPRDLAEVVEMLLDKGIVINADIVVSIGERELLGVEVRAAIASFETAAKYGLAFPSGTDPERLRAAVDLDEPIEAPEGDWSAMPDASRGGTRAIDAPIGEEPEAADDEGEATDDEPNAPTRSPGPAQTPESTEVARPEEDEGSDSDQNGGSPENGENDSPGEDAESESTEREEAGSGGNDDSDGGEDE